MKQSTLLTTEAIDQLHATGVSENLFLVGPQQAVVIEADAVRHTIHDITDVLVMSNYRKRSLANTTDSDHYRLHLHLKQRKKHGYDVAPLSILNLSVG